MSLSPRRRTTAVLAAVGMAAAATTVALLTGGSSAGAAPGCPTEPSFDTSIPAPQGPPAATALPDGTVGFSILGADAKTYWVNSDISVDPLLVSPLLCLGGGAVDNPAVTATPTGVVFVVRNAAGKIYANDVAVTEAPPTSTGWRQLPSGIAAGGPAVVGGTDGSVALFVRGANGALYQAVRNPAGAWSGFRSLGGGFVGTPAVAARPGGGLVVVVRNAAGLVYTKSSTPAGVWSGWTRLPGEAAGSPTLTAGFAEGRLDLFVVGKAGGLYQSAYTAGRFNGFRRIESTLAPTTRIAAAGSPGSLIVYITETVGGTAVSAYTQYIPGGWTEARLGYQYLLTPYSCEECLPDVSTATQRSAGNKRPLQPTPLR